MVNLQVVKSADRSYVFLGTSNRIRYSIFINNLGDERANCVKVRDILTKGVSFIPGTLIVNGCRKDGLSCNEEIVIGSIEPGGNSVINFEAEIQRNYSQKSIVNKVRVTWVDDYGNIGTVESNELIIPVININVCLKKVVDKRVAKVGEILSYSVFIRNNSNIDITDVVFYDALPVNLTLLPSSVLVGSEVQYVENFNGGIPIGDIKANSSIIVSFQAEVSYLPRPSVITNVANVNYYYTVYDNEIPVTSTGESTSNCVISKILLSDCGC